MLGRSKIYQMSYRLREILHQTIYVLVSLKLNERRRAQQQLSLI